jgi:hypothetical protein
LIVFDFRGGFQPLEVRELLDIGEAGAVVRLAGAGLRRETFGKDTGDPFGGDPLFFEGIEHQVSQTGAVLPQVRGDSSGLEESHACFLGGGTRNQLPRNRPKLILGGRH